MATSGVTGLADTDELENVGGVEFGVQELSSPGAGGRCAVLPSTDSTDENGGGVELIEPLISESSCASHESEKQRDRR